MENKVLTIIEILAILIAVTIYAIKVTIPEYKNSLGSSDKFINTENYKEMYEISIDKDISVALLINKENTVYHILFFNENSTCLYNTNIEGNTIESALEKVTKTLITNNYLKTTSIIMITNYQNNDSKYFKESFYNAINKFGIFTTIYEKESSIEKKCEELNIETEKEDKEMLSALDLYSKDIVSNIKDDVSTKRKEKEEINDKNYRTYTDNVYKKIERYIIEKNKKNEISNPNELVITLIPINEDGTKYPTSKSWYYVKDNKIYAYIEITDDDMNQLGICYNGSIDNIKRGEC